MNPCFDWIDQRIAAIADQSRLRTLVAKEPLADMRIRIGGRELINFGSNDYLGIASENIVTSRSRQTGSGASALVSGFTPIHQRLQETISDLEDSEASLLFPTGYAANLGTISALAEAGDLILSDAINHASIIDGCRLSKAERYIYPHADATAVRALLESHRRRFRRVYIVTDSIFSMDGDAAPLEALSELADRFDATIIVDEAHATGIFGQRGSGLCEELLLSDRIPIRIGTLSKAVGAAGGFVAAPKNVIDYLVNRARPFIYSTAMPPIIAEAALSGLEIVKSQPQRRQRLLALASRMRDRISDSWKISPQPSPIIPLIVGHDEVAEEMARHLDRAGFYVPAIRPPTVPQGTARLRISVSAGHTESAIDELASILCKLARR